jgi:hypothetical protein
MLLKNKFASFLLLEKIITHFDIIALKKGNI